MHGNLNGFAPLLRQISEGKGVGAPRHRRLTITRVVAPHAATRVVACVRSVRDAPLSGIFAAILGWLAFRERPTRWRIVGGAAVVLLPPYVIALPLGAGEFMRGPNPLFLFPSLVAIVITTVGIQRYREESQESAMRVRQQVRAELHQRYDRNRMKIDASERPADPPCPQCGATLSYFDSEISSGAFRPQAASMPQLPIHYYDCAACNTAWKFGTKLLPDPIRQILKT